MNRDPLETKALKLLRTLCELPRRTLPEVPFFSQFVALPDARLELGQEAELPEERELIDAVVEMLVQRQLKQYPPGVRPMLRDFHAKAHGCFLAELEIGKQHPADYRQGSFAAVGETRQAIVRLSNGTRQVQADALRTPHGLALKIFGAPTPSGTHDLLLSDYPVTFTGTVAAAWQFFQLEAADVPQAYMASVLPLRFRARLFAIALLSAPENVPEVLDLEYFSQTPYRLGPSAACKYLATPLCRSGNDEPPPDDPNYQQARILDRLRRGPVEFALCVQRQMHPLRQPIEDASIEWDPRESVPVRVATLRILPLDQQRGLVDSAQRRWACERLSFRPHNAPPDNAPVGGVNRLRRRVYETLSQLRHDANRVPMREPRSIDDFVDGNF